MLRKYAPVLVLFVLSPLVAEVLLGATTLSHIGGLLPVSLLYGGGALLIRELARRRGTGWGRILLLGAAYGIAEEGLVIQSLFNPNLFNAAIVGGRALGVNWVWTQWTLGYHAVWSMLIPILLAELLFPARARESWLGRLGLLAAGGLYLLGALVIGAAFRFVVAPGFNAPLPQLLGAALAAAALAALALAWPARTSASQAGTAGVPARWLVGLLAALAAAGWFALLDLPHALRQGTLAFLAMLAVGALAGAVLVALNRWQARPAWGGLHALAGVAGALVISMLFGFFAVTASNPLDQAGQGAGSLAALALLGLFALRLRGRTAAQPQPSAAR